MSPPKNSEDSEMARVEAGGFPELPESLDRRKRARESERTLPESWRDVVEIHPAADLFPTMSEAELRELGEDIEKNGMRSPIVFLDASDEFPVARLLDGRNRLDAMELVGVKVLGDLKAEFPFQLASGNVSYRIIPSDTDPVGYVISANIWRRHLTGEQKRELIGRLLKAAPQRSNRAIAETAKADDKTVGTIRRDMEATAEIPQLQKTTGKDGRARATQPKRLHVSRQDRRARKQHQIEPLTAGVPSLILEGLRQSLAAFITQADRVLPTLSNEDRTAILDELHALTSRHSAIMTASL